MSKRNFTGAVISLRRETRTGKKEGREMAEEEAAAASASSAAAAAKGNGENSVEDLQRTVIQSKDTAIRSAPSLLHSSSSQLRSMQDNVPHAVSKFKTYEDAFFNKVKDQLMAAREHPAAVVGVGMTAGLILMRGPRRFLFRHTLGRFQSEEAQFLKAEKNVKDFELSVDLMKKESKKLLERAALAEKDMKQGYDELMDAGSQLQHLAKSVYKVEKQAADLVDGLREIPGWEALKLRSEAASMVSTLKQQRMALDKRLIKISELGVSI